jgi:hypothetical protein
MFENSPAFQRRETSGDRASLKDTIESFSHLLSRPFGTRRDNAPPGTEVPGYYRWSLRDQL